jgi:hypothetical protein
MMIIDNLTYDELLLLQSIINYVDEQNLEFFTENVDFDSLYEKVMSS